MAHTYASLAEAMNFLRDEGATGLWSAASTNNLRALSTLESASRRVDEWCGRSAFGSGFGPRTAVNRYDGTATADLDLQDDVLSISGISCKSSTVATNPVSIVADTDYYLRNQRGLYDTTPYRKVILHGQGALAVFGYGFRVTTVTGVAGYSNTSRTLTATASAIGDTTGTSVTVSAATEFSPGQTLLIGTEQLYVRDQSTVTLTVDRGVNGTTAATHGAAAPVAKYVYDSAVVDTTLRLFLKRWRSRDAGANGVDGGGDVGVTQYGESEDTILRRGVGHLRLNVQVST